MVKGNCSNKTYVHAFSSLLDTWPPYADDYWLHTDKILAQIGTKNVLEAVSRTRGIVRTVLTSSVLAMVNNWPQQLIAEEDWNTVSTLESNAYSFSKVI